MRHGKGLVQVEVAHVGAHRAGGGQAHLRVHVGTVHIHLTAVLVYNLDDVEHRFLEHTVRGRIGDHEAGDLLAEVVHVDFTVLGRFHHADLEASLGGRGRVGAVRGGGNQADVAVSLTDVVQVVADDGQTGILASSTGVGLERHGLETGDGAQPVAHLVDHFEVGVWSAGAYGWMLQVAAQLNGSISAAAFSFMVQLPSGIIARLSDKSLISNIFI